MSAAGSPPGSGTTQGISPAISSEIAPGDTPGSAGQAQPAHEAVQRARHAASTARQAAATRARRTQDEREMFSQPGQDYLYQALGRPLNVLRAGTRTPIGELGLARLRDSGYQIILTTVDQDTPLTRAVLSEPGARPAPRAR